MERVGSDNRRDDDTESVLCDEAELTLQTRSASRRSSEEVKVKSEEVEVVKFGRDKRQDMKTLRLSTLFTYSLFTLTFYFERSKASLSTGQGQISIYNQNVRVHVPI